MGRVKKIYVIKDVNVTKIDDLCIELSLKKSDIVNMAIEEFSCDLNHKLVKVGEKKRTLMSELDMLNLKIEEIEHHINKEDGLKEELKVEIRHSKKIIKAKFLEGEKLKGLGIAKRMAGVLGCHYLDLLPLKS